jgi:drug/metabolite transporter (DMT)-like permease/CheY-like chemotaxis protein
LNVGGVTYQGRQLVQNKHEDETKTSPSRILIVDDYKTNRLKMSAAVAAFGHETLVAADGETALSMLAESRVDLVLLDIVMPGMSGFQVLKAMKSEAALRDIPVIIISALESQMQSVVDAIEQGAEDFLPKDFEPALLKARLNTCLERKRLRDQEKQYLSEVAKLTSAAQVLEHGKYNPEKLGLGDIAARSDGLGALAKVFSTMAREVYLRERRLRQNIRTARGGLLLLLCGGCLGLSVPLSKMAANIAVHPVGLSLVVNFLCALICLAIVLPRGVLPDPRKFSSKEWSYIFVLSVFASSKVFVYLMTSKLPSSTVAVIMVLEGFMVFLFSAVLGIERPNIKRLLGLALGLFGVVLVVWLNDDTGGAPNWFWFLVALTIPAMYASEDLFISQRRPPDVDVTSLYVFVCLVACLLHLPLAFALDDFVPIDLLWGKLGALSLLMAATWVVAVVSLVYLIATTGAVFASQSAYVITLAGLLWSMLLLGERLQPIVWFALVLIIIGLILVEPKHEAEEEPPMLIRQ